MDSTKSQVITIDCRGLACPRPVVNTRDALDKMRSGTLVCIVDNEAARQNVSNFAKSRGLQTQVEQKGGDFHIVIEVPATGERHQSPAGSVPDTGSGAGVQPIQPDKASMGRVYVFKSKHLGTGDDELGQVLMKSFAYTLRETKPYPKALVFLNSGVFLTVSGSPILEHLEALHKAGVDIMSCGTCLDFYGIKDKLAVGRVTNMYEIVENLARETTIMI